MIVDDILETPEPPVLVGSTTSSLSLQWKVCSHTYFYSQDCKDPAFLHMPKFVIFWYQ